TGKPALELFLANAQTANAFNITSGSGSGGDLFNIAANGIPKTHGDRSVASNVTNATTTFANLTDLTVNLQAGKKYTGTLVIYATDSTAADGLKLDFNGGSATMTTFEAGFASVPPGAPTLGTITTTALGTALTVSTATTADAVYTIQIT